MILEGVHFPTCEPDCPGHVQGELHDPAASPTILALPQLESQVLAVVDRVEQALAAADNRHQVVEIRDEAERLAVFASIKGFHQAAVKLTNAVRTAEIKYVQLTPKTHGNQYTAARNASDPNVTSTPQPNPRSVRDWRKAAEIDPDTLSELQETAIETGTPLTRQAVIDAARPPAPPPPAPEPAPEPEIPEIEPQDPEPPDTPDTPLESPPDATDSPSEPEPQPAPKPPKKRRLSKAAQRMELITLAADSIRPHLESLESLADEIREMAESAADRQPDAERTARMEEHAAALSRISEIEDILTALEELDFDW